MEAAVDSSTVLPHDVDVLPQFMATPFDEKTMERLYKTKNGQGIGTLPGRRKSTVDEIDELPIMPQETYLNSLAKGQLGTDNEAAGNTIYREGGEFLIEEGRKLLEYKRPREHDIEQANEKARQTETLLQHQHDFQQQRLVQLSMQRTLAAQNQFPQQYLPLPQAAATQQFGGYQFNPWQNNQHSFGLQGGAAMTVANYSHSQPAQFSQAKEAFTFPQASHLPKGAGSKPTRKRKQPKIVEATGDVIQLTEANLPEVEALPVAFGYFVNDTDSKAQAESVTKRLSKDSSKRARAKLLLEKPAKGLGEGWVARTFERVSGATAGQTDTYFYSPREGLKFRAMKGCRIFVEICREAGVDGDEKKAWRLFKERGNRA
mmetsp:Transcript_18685/g.43767  ORF Transcript_18685/g.43767 Transcript_18685/m.43767 type:complete len:374 (+) Transcript_18685:201-1322(+)